jgi:UDP-N-acetylmuramoyl-tripeptide--D-alanyl-D-alanine ligase
MKNFSIKSLQSILTKLARLTAARYHPHIIGITGSVGKTSAKNAIAAVLGTAQRLRASSGNFNNEMGLPLAVIGEWSEEELHLVSRDYPAGKDRFKKAMFWVRVIGWGLGNIVAFRNVKYPQTLVLEYGADRPGDIKKLLKIARPTIAVITAIGEVPVHVEYYQSAADVAREKARLIEQLPSGGFAVLNADDETVFALKDRTRARIMTYGFSKNAHVQISAYEIKIVEGMPYGISFKLGYGGSFVPVVLSGVFGRAQASSCAAAAAVGLILGLNLVKISEGLKRYRVAPSRLNFLQGIHGSYVLDDSYNASPLSMASALETLESIPAKRRIAVLGDMLEIGSYSMEAHQALGKQAAKIADILVTVGPHAKFIAESAIENGMNKKNVFPLDDVEEAQKLLFDMVRKGDVVLVKASHAMGFAEIVEGLRQAPEEEIENVNISSRDGSVSSGKSENGNVKL